MCDVTIRRKAEADCGGIGAVADLLPEWFTPTARERIPVDAGFGEGVVAVLNGQIVGFVLFFVWEAVGHISWIGVHPDHHRRGIGRRLLEHVEATLKEGGVGRLEVQTLSESVDYEPYERTRAFYTSVGFEPYRRQQHDNPECPESLDMRKAL